MDTEKNMCTETEGQEIRSDETSADYSEDFQPKPVFTLDKSDAVFAVFAIIASIFTAAFGVFGGFAFGYLLSLFLMNTVLCVYFVKAGKMHAFSVLCLLLSLATGAVFMFTSNGSVRFFGVVICFLLSFVAFDGFINGASCGNRQTVGIFYSALSTAGNCLASVKSLFLNGNGDRKSIGKVFVGLLCALPVLFVVVPLLISSDDAFGGMMNNIFSNTSETIFIVVCGLFCSVFVISYGFSLKTGRTAKLTQKNLATIENVYIISFLSTIAVSYLMYLFSQLAYFFSAFSGFLPNGEITYSQYARKGFFEMCIIAVINLAIVFAALIIAKKKDGKVCHGIKALTTFIAVFTLIIISTAISKMMLYIDVYGMTVLRLTTSAFMLFLAIVFISVILRIYLNRINVVKTALLAAGCIVFVLGTVNVNAVCARYNYESYKSGKLETIDVRALYELGYEGIPYIVRLAENANDQTQYDAEQYLAFAYVNDYFDNVSAEQGFNSDTLKQNRLDKGFEFFSIPKHKAYKALYAFIDDNAEFCFECEDYLYDTRYDY